MSRQYTHVQELLPSVSAMKGECCTLQEIANHGCSSCGALKFVPFRCKSRFCPSCGNLYSIQRTTSMSFKIIECVHRHCVLLSPKNFVSSSTETVLYLTVFFILSAMSSLACSANSIKLSVLLPDSPVFSIPLTVVSSGILTFMFLYLKLPLGASPLGNI